jgi:hypothetical protein
MKLTSIEVKIDTGFHHISIYNTRRRLHLQMNTRRTNIV